MASRFAILVCLVAAALFVSPVVMADKSFDFFYLILQWPGSYCAQRAGCCKPTTGFPARDFFIRSFETYDGITGLPVRRCNKTPLDVKDLLENEGSGMQQFWSSIKCPSNNGVNFWKNVWKYYGVCSNMTQSGYFAHALALRSKLDPLSALQKKGIVPGKVPYSVDSIRSAIKEAIGVTPVIRCSQSPAFPKNFLLFEIYICVATDGETPIDCPITPYFKCSDVVVFPPFDYDMLKDTTAPSDDDQQLQDGDVNPILMPTISTE